MFRPMHISLIFSQAQIETAKTHRLESPFDEAWKLLDAHSPISAVEAAQLNGLRYRFNKDVHAGAITLANLETHLSADLDLNRAINEVIVEAFVWTQCVELVRNHPNMTDSQLTQFIARLSGYHDQLAHYADENDLLVSESLWLMVFNMALSIVTEDKARFNACVATYKDAIDSEVHPEGYLPRAIDGETGLDNFINQIRSVQALVLMAEMARHVGVDLYAYNNRGVSVITAATYPLYYYFYPEKWKWVEEVYKGGKKIEAETISDDDAKRIYREHAGFLEILNLYYDNRPLKAIRMILDDLRPTYDMSSGGLTTLTHGYTERKRRRLFG